MSLSWKEFKRMGLSAQAFRFGAVVCRDISFGLKVGRRVKGVIQCGPFMTRCESGGGDSRPKIDDNGAKVLVWVKGDTE
jgi:hypothetical protein